MNLEKVEEKKATIQYQVGDMIIEQEPILDFDEIIAKGIAGQRKILEAQLANGVPLHYEDNEGNWVEERPNGEIVILEEASIRYAEFQ